MLNSQCEHNFTESNTLCKIVDCIKFGPWHALYAVLQVHVYPCYDPMVLQAMVVILSR